MLFLYWGLTYIEHRIKLTTINILSLLYLVCIYGYSIYIGSLQGFSDPFIVITLILFICYAFTHHPRELFVAALIFYVFFGVWQFYLEITYSYVDEFEVTENWLVENKNVVVRYFLPGMMFTLLNSNCNNYGLLSYKTVVPLTLLATTIIMSTSATGIIGTLLFLFFAFLFKNKMPQRLTINAFLILTMASFALILFYNVQENFTQYLELFGKDATLSNRTEVWFFAVEQFLRNPILGNGVGSVIEGANPLMEFHHAHNYWLEALRATGLIGTGMLLTIYVISSNNFKKQGNGNASTRLFVITIITFLIMGIDESLTNAYMLIPILNLSGVKGVNKVK